MRLSRFRGVQCAVNLPLRGAVQVTIMIEHRVRIVSPEVAMEPLLQLLDEAEAVPLVISGGSMTPFLAHGRDTVYLSKVRTPLKRGDVALYQRDNGRYVLHRVVRAENGLYTMLGDAQTHREPGVREDQLRAVATAVRRKGRLLKKGDFLWEFFARVWIGLVPLRPVLRKACGLVGRLSGRKEHT